jgi:tetratricopeptide (TPR) repeat protein
MAGATLEAFQRDPVAEAAYSSARGLVMAQDLARLEAADPDDLLAIRARAMYAKRSGNLAQADAEYQRLLEVRPDDPVIANNAANVRLALGHMGDAIDLYRLAASESGSPIVLFNLAQAHGLTFQVDELSQALSRAQELDRETVARLTELQASNNTAFVVDLPLPVSLMWRRIPAAMGGGALAAQLRRPFAPGRLGGGHTAVLALCGVALSGSIVGLGVQARRGCGRCGRLLCPRCEPRSGERDVCESCFQLFYKSENANRDLRMARIDVLRKRERRRSRMAWVVAVVVPGVAGQLASRPLRGFLGAVLFALAAACIVLRDGVVSDPLVAGAAGPIAFVGLGTLAALAYVLVLATSLAARRRA